MENEIFKTDQFSWEGDTLKLLRKGFVLEKIPVAEISFCIIKRARVVKRPLLLAGFGLICLFPLIWFAIYWYGVIFQFEIGLSGIDFSQGYHRAIAIQIIVVGFCGFVGVFSLFSVIRKSVSLEIRLKDQRSFLFDLQLLQKNNRLKEIIEYLKKKRVNIMVDL
jgi:hypothetical protein